MTRRRRTPASLPEIDASAFPHARVFFEGYLHQDFAIVHGDAAKALAACRADLGENARAALDEELARLGATLAHVPLQAARQVILDLGGEWWPASRADLRRILPG